MLPGRDQRTVYFFSVSPPPTFSLTAWSSFSSLPITLPGWVISLLIKRLDNEHSTLLWLRPLLSHRSVPPELIGTFSAGALFSPLILPRMAFGALPCTPHPSCYCPSPYPLPDCVSLDGVIVFCLPLAVWFAFLPRCSPMPAGIDFNCRFRK